MQQDDYVVILKDYKIVTAPTFSRGPSLFGHARNSDETKYIESNIHQTIFLNLFFKSIFHNGVSSLLRCMTTSRCTPQLFSPTHKPTAGTPTFYANLQHAFT